jgi:hypothetical protein
MAKNVFQVLSKGGREFEAEFSTQERAEAFIWAKDPYMALVDAEEVPDDEWKDLADSEIEADATESEYGFLSDLDRFRLFLLGCSAAAGHAL